MRICSIFKTAMLPLVLAFFSIGFMREVFAKSLPMDAIFEDARLIGIVGKQKRPLMQNTVAFYDNQEESMDVQIQELDASVDYRAALDNIKDEIRQSFVLVKTRTTRQRGKRYIQQRAHLTPCLFKICNMGRKRQSHPL